MEMIIVSGAGTLVLLVALLLDYVFAPDVRRLASVDGAALNPSPAFRVAGPPSPDRMLAHDRAA